MASALPRRPVPTPRVPHLIAHRGYTAHYPENTLSALEAAARGGASFVEVDVQLSADRVPILFHDKTLERICGESGAVHEHGWSPLSALRASEPTRFGARFADEPLARLADVAGLLRRYPGLTAFIEAKGIAIERFGVDAVLQAITTALSGVADRYVLISFSLEFLARARALTRQPLGAVIQRWDRRTAVPLQALRPEYLFCDRTGLPEAGPLAAPAGARIAVYEVAEGEEALALAARGVDMIETFAIGEMLTFMRGRTPAARNHD